MAGGLVGKAMGGIFPESLIWVGETGPELEGAKKVKLGDLFKQSFYDWNAPVLAKCQHCGQWGAVRCECLKCGAPIDPPQKVTKVNVTTFSDPKPVFIDGVKDY